jgi:transcription antitermination factor NusB
MKKREQRRLALQALFAMEFNPTTFEESIEAAMDDETEKETKMRDKERLHLLNLVSETWKYKEDLDQLLAPHVEDWSLERIFSIDRILCRIALFEMYKAEQPLSAGIAINEVVELAKEFGEDESPRFINGILGAVVKANERVDSGS